MRAAILMGVLLMSATAQAHNPQAASFRLLDAGDRSFLRVSLSTHGAAQALRNLHPEQGGLEVTDKAGKEVLVDHLKSCVTLQTARGVLRLGNGAMRVGRHQTDLRFRLQSEDVSGVTGESTGKSRERLELPLDVHIDCFSANPHQQNMFRYVRQQDSARVVLSQSRGLHARLLRDREGGLSWASDAQLSEPEGRGDGSLPTVPFLSWTAVAAAALSLAKFLRVW